MPGSVLTVALVALPFAIHDFTPDFWRFWEAAQNQPAERQAQLWQQLYVAPHQKVFDDLATPCKDQYDAGWFRANYLKDLPRIVPAIRTMVADLPRQLDEANRRFLKTFPDMRWSGDIYVMGLWLLLRRTRAKDRRTQCAAVRRGHDGVAWGRRIRSQSCSTSSFTDITGSFSSSKVRAAIRFGPRCGRRASRRSLPST
jgi:hypothetical protein